MPPTEYPKDTVKGVYPELETLKKVVELHLQAPVRLRRQDRKVGNLYYPHAIGYK